MKFHPLSRAALVAAFLFSTHSAFAADNKLQEAFRSMSSPAYTDAQSAKRYNGALRSGVDFGSGRISTGVATSNVSLVNFTPPQATVGCSGIDFHLGGISWVNWDQFSALLDSVLMAAQYAVVNMALDWISEKLGATFKAVMNALQKATEMEIDACKIGKALAQRAVDSFSNNSGDSGEAFCQERAQQDGTADGHSTASRLCINFNTQVEKRLAWLQNAKYNMGLGGMRDSDGSTPAKETGDTNVETPKLCVDNCTWLTLRGAGFAPTLKAKSGDPAAAVSDPEVYNYLAGTAFSELLMSGVGYRWGEPQGQKVSEIGTEIQTKKAGDIGPPTLTPQAFVAIFMCGTNYLNANSEAQLMFDAAAAGTASGNNDVRENLMTSTLSQIKGICEVLRKPGASDNKGEQLKIITCMPEDVAKAYAKGEGDYSGANTPVLSALAAIGGDIKNAKDLCQFPQEIPISVWAKQPYVTASFLSEGILSRNMRIMQNIFAKLIRGNVPLVKEEVDFILSSPTPVYQMLSMAALFPLQGMELVNSEALMITSLQTQAFIDKLVNDASKGTDPKIPIFDQDMLKILTFLDSTSKVYGSVNVDVDKQLSRMTAFQAQINVMQKAVMDSIYGRGLMGNLTFSADITRAGT